jgi:hypothetical protein
MLEPAREESDTSNVRVAFGARESRGQQATNHIAIEQLVAHSHIEEASMEGGRQGRLASSRETRQPEDCAVRVVTMMHDSSVDAECQAHVTAL